MVLLLPTILSLSFTSSHIVPITNSFGTKDIPSGLVISIFFTNLTISINPPKNDIYYKPITKKIKGFLKKKNDDFEKFIQLKEITIKMFVTAFLTFILFVTYLFCYAGQNESKKNRYPLFCKSFHVEKHKDFYPEYECRINGSVLYTEKDPSDVSFLYLFINGPDGVYDNHHIKYIDKNG